MSGAREDIMFYDGINFSYFDLDSGYQIKCIFKEGKNVFCSAFKNFHDSTYSYFESNMNIYKYDGNLWDIVFSDTVQSGSTYIFPSPYSNLINQKMYARTNFTLFGFDGNMFYPVLNSNDLYFGADIAGTSLNDFMVIGGTIGDEQGIFHWNGLKWSIEIYPHELVIFPANLIYKLISVNQNYYLLGKGFSTPYLFYSLRHK